MMNEIVDCIFIEKNIFDNWPDKLSQVHRLPYQSANPRQLLHRFSEFLVGQNIYAYLDIIFT